MFLPVINCQFYNEGIQFCMQYNPHALFRIYAHVSPGADIPHP